MITQPKAELENTIATRIAERLVNTRYEDLPADVVLETKRMILDSVGVGVSGMTHEKGKIALTVARRTMPGSEATVLGFGEKLSVMGAAFVNGDAMNALDNTIVCPPGHLVEYVIPAILAYAQAHHISGKEVIRAVALGIELTHRIGKACPYHRDVEDGKPARPPVHGFAASIFGCAAGVALLKGLDVEHMADTLGIAGWMSPINGMEIWGQHVRSGLKYGSGGEFAILGILAAEYAENELEGDWKILDDDKWAWGNLVAYKRWKPELIKAETIGQEWFYPSKQSYKLYPACRMLATPADLTIQLVKGNQIDPSQIESIFIQCEAGVSEGPQWSNKNPRTLWEGENSMFHCIALCCLGIEPGPRWTDASVVYRPEVKELRNKVHIEVHPDYVTSIVKDPGSRPTHVEITLKDGTVYKADGLYPRGNNVPETSYMQDEELLGKYFTNCERLLQCNQIEKSAKAIMALETYDDAAEVVNLCGILG